LGVETTVLPFSALLLSASLRFALPAILRLFEFISEDFIGVFRLARQPPARFSVNC
jgi:hypothetical protein